MVTKTASETLSTPKIGMIMVSGNVIIVCTKYHGSITSLSLSDKQKCITTLGYSLNDESVS